MEYVEVVLRSNSERMQALCFVNVLYLLYQPNVIGMEYRYGA